MVRSLLRRYCAQVIHCIQILMLLARTPIGFLRLNPIGLHQRNLLCEFTSAKQLVSLRTDAERRPKCSSCLFRENIQHHRRQGYCNPQKNHGCHDAEEHPALRVLKNRQSAFLEKKLQLRCTQTTERLIPRRRRLYQKEARRTSFFIAICAVCDSGKMGFTMKPQRKHQAEGADHRLARLL